MVPLALSRTQPGVFDQGAGAVEACGVASARTPPTAGTDAGEQPELQLVEDLDHTSSTSVSRAFVGAPVGQHPVGANSQAPGTSAGGDPGCDRSGRRTSRRSMRRPGPVGRPSGYELRGAPPASNRFSPSRASRSGSTVPAIQPPPPVRGAAAIQCELERQMPQQSTKPARRVQGDPAAAARTRSPRRSAVPGGHQDGGAAPRSHRRVQGHNSEAGRPGGRSTPHPYRRFCRACSPRPLGPDHQQRLHTHQGHILLRGKLIEHPPAMPGRLTPNGYIGKTVLPATWRAHINAGPNFQALARTRRRANTRES